MAADSPGRRRNKLPTQWSSYGDGTIVTPPNQGSPIGDFGVPVQDDNDLHSSNEKVPVVVIQNGLKFRSTSSKETCLSLTYACLPGVHPTPVDCRICCYQDASVSDEYITYIKVADTNETLCAVVEGFSDLVQGLIIINSSLSTTLPSSFIKDGVPKELPVYVISSQDGNHLDEFMTVPRTGHVQVTVLAEDDRFTSGKTSQDKLKAPFILIEQLKWLLIVGKNERALVSEEKVTFEFLNSCFHNYELQSKRESPDKAVKMLDNVNDEMFNKDFLFYLLIAYRFLKYSKIYGSAVEVAGYIQHCIARFEAMDMCSIADVMHAFVQREDFTVQWYPYTTNSDCSVFSLLCNMAACMLEKSKTLKGRASRFTVYERILWISVSWFFGMRGDIQPSKLSSLWHRGLLHEKGMKLSDEVVTHFSHGFELFQLLKLPNSALFDITDFASFLNPLECERLHFSHIKKLLNLGVSLFSWNVKTFCHFLPPLRSNYILLLRNSVEWNNRYSADGTKLGFYKEVLAFVRYAFEVLPKRVGIENDKEVAYLDTAESEIQNFLYMLVDHVDFKADNAMDFLNEIRQGVQLLREFDKVFSKNLTAAINAKGKIEAKKLTPAQFSSLFKDALFWEYSFVQEFLNNCPTPPDTDLKEPSWSIILTEIINRFSDVNCRKSILNLIERVGEAYRNGEKEHNFVLDIMKLDVLNLFELETDYEIETAFIEMIPTYIRKNGLHLEIMKQTLAIVDLVKEGNDFQHLILKTIQKEIVPDSMMLESLSVSQRKDVQILQSLIIKSVEIASKSLALSHLSAVDQFYWNFIASCCNRIQLDSKTLYKFRDYAFVLEKFSKIFQTYCKGTLYVLDEVPKDILNNDIKEYFKWIIKMQNICCHWHEKFMKQDYNYDDTLTYVSSLQTMKSVAKYFGTDKLVFNSDQTHGFKKKYSKLYAEICVLLVKNHKDVPSCITLMEILNCYGVRLSNNLQVLLHKYVVLPGEKYPNDVQQKLSQSDYQVDLKPEDILLLRTSTTVQVLQELHCGLEDFLRPFLSNIEFLVYFHLHNCKLFCNFLNCQIAKMSMTLFPTELFSTKTFLLTTNKQSNIELHDRVIQFGTAVENTKHYILSLIMGTAKYEDIVTEGSLEELLQNCDLTKEFELMSRFPGFEQDMMSSENTEGREGIQHMLELVQFSQQLSVIPEVCEQYHLSQCLKDEKLVELQEITKSVKTVEGKAKITGKDASNYMKQIWQALHCDDTRQATRSLKLFSAVADNAEFYRFIKGKGFKCDPRSKSAFESQVDLIKAQLQHEDYSYRVWNHLKPAFQYISPFLDADQNFSELMDKIVKLFNEGSGFGCDSNKDFCQLETINSNISHIQLWFSRAEGDTVENVSIELECIMSTGYFKLITQNKSDNGFSPTETNTIARFHSEVVLCFEPMSEFYYKKYKSRTVTVSDVECFVDNSTSTPTSAESQSIPSPEMWNREQIDDFVRKLGFLEEQTADLPVKTFQQLNQIAQTLYNTVSKLRDLGHPEYLDITETISCSSELESLKDKVSIADNKLKKWSAIIRNLYNKYAELAFFSVSKVLSLYDSLKVNFSADKVVQEIGFLFRNKDTVIQKLKRLVKNVSDCLSDTDSRSKEVPVEYVGKYLQHLCKESSIAEDFLHSRSQPSASSPLLPFQEVVYYAPHYDNERLLLLLIEIYNGVPESYEVFHCNEESAEDDLKLFLHRATKFKCQKFTILEVNRLPYKLQELIVHHHSQKMEPAAYLTYIETGKSVLDEVPWVKVEECKKSGPEITLEKVKIMCEELVNNDNANFYLELVYGCAGDGKTHYIRKQLHEGDVIIAVNESFTVLNTIMKLQQLTPYQKNCAIFFNFTVVPPPSSATSEEKLKYKRHTDMLAWFFCKLLLFGYVEDLDTGMAFRLPGGLQWKIFVEIPSYVQENETSSLQEMVTSSFNWFCNKIPIFKLIGKCIPIDNASPYDVDSSVQLVCKYLRAYDHRNDARRGINKLYTENAPNTEVRFDRDSDLTVDDCHQLLKHHMPSHVAASKVLQRLFIKYMERRCTFLQNCPVFVYNQGYGRIEQSEIPNDEDEVKKLIKDKILKKMGGYYYSNTSKLGEVLMETMLQEVSEFCKIDVRQNWSTQAHQQLLYGADNSIQFITLNPHNLDQDKVKKFNLLGIKIPSIKQIFERQKLDFYLSSALGILLEEDGKLQDIDESQYVLTLDYTMKMLNIHERRQCGIPVIIEGETGVGKTALINMLSKLWNHTLIDECRTAKKGIIEILLDKAFELDDRKLTSDLLELSLDGWHVDKHSDTRKRHLNREDLIPLMEMNHSDHMPYYEFINKMLVRKIKDEPIWELIEVDCKTPSRKLQPTPFYVGVENASIVAEVVDEASRASSPQATAKMLCSLLNSNLTPSFYKLNVHAALTPKNIKDFLIPILNWAVRLKELHAAKKFKESPVVTIFLDELNTSSCLGLFKEMIVDNSFEGKPLPSNIFIVAACNPHRGDSLAVHTKQEDIEGQEDQESPNIETWFKGSYYVQKLHPTLKFLLWNYGQLDAGQEADYINAKMTMINKDFKDTDNITFSTLIVTCQKMIRRFAHNHLRMFMDNEHEAEKRAESCVSQRDIQRVFTFYSWIIKTYQALTEQNKGVDNKEVDDKDVDKALSVDSNICAHPVIKNKSSPLDMNHRAILVALGLVYYMRLDTNYRKMFIADLDGMIKSYCINFETAFNDEVNYYTDELSLPTGIAKTEALKENLFATIICTVTNTPLIIVGAPGSSKTLSFNLTISNLKGSESKLAFFRNTDIFKALDPQNYQCSRHTTSTEIGSVFKWAIDRQQSHHSYSLPIQCVVFMDEAGLPEESHESLKVLHYHLDEQEVAFVGITNHVLDAAKTNRAVSLFRPTPSKEDLDTLAMGCLCANPKNPPLKLKQDLETVVKFCPAYCQIMEDKRFNNFFGLRDFIHFINYLRRKSKGDITPHLVLQSLERNFNGSKHFDHICTLFLKQMETDLYSKRTIIEILSDSLQDKPYNNQNSAENSLDDTQNEVRYKLIIDPSEDESVTRLLFMFDVLEFENTRTFMCSNFPGDSQLQKINTIAAIRHSALEGHTVIMSQTDDIHESFYDLFNQNFRKIDDPEHGLRFYTNVAIGAFTKPSRVGQKFQCIVIIKESEIKNTPAPFLNRFEKYFISHKNLLDLALDKLPPCLKVIVNSAHEKVGEFYSLLERSTFYGGKDETVISLLLTIIPRPGHKYEMPSTSSLMITNYTGTNNRIMLFQILLKCLHEIGGFCYMENPEKELEHDANSIIDILAATGSQFSGVAKKIDSCDQVTVSQWIVEALNLVYTSTVQPNIDGRDSNKHGTDDFMKTLGASVETCMVIALITQWLVRFMCKKLMQLMTPEAAILKRKSIPISYLEIYLKFQSHFSLKELISKHIQMLNQCTGNKVATKLICYTRSDSLIHQLPLMYPMSAYSTTEEFERSKNCIETFIHDKAENLVICKFSSISSQTSFRLQLQSFKDTSQNSIFVLVINMKETAPQIVNHIRVMIEEVDNSSRELKKLFVLLLHFPPTMFYEPCYPSLFLDGWDHHYLDTISQCNQYPLMDATNHAEKTPVVDIRKWFEQSCLSSEEVSPSKTTCDDPMCKQLLCFLNEPESIQVLASRILLPMENNTPQVQYEFLKKLYIDKQVGNVLCLKFRLYWKPSVVGSHLEQAASFAKSRESTLSISDFVDSMCKTAFFNFIAKMTYQISEGHDLMLLLDSYPEILKLFRKLLEVYPVPKLPEVKAFNNTFDCRVHVINKTSYSHQFPFFKEISTYIDDLIQQTIAQSNENIHILQEDKVTEVTAGSKTKEEMFKMLYSSLCDEVSKSMKDKKVVGKKNMITVAIKEMLNNDEMWHTYYNNFISHYLHMSTTPDNIEHKILCLTFDDVLSSYSEMKVIAAHCYLHLYQLDLAKLVTLLKPLQQLKLLRVEDSMYPEDPESTLMLTVQQSQSVQESSLSKFVIDSLFAALSNVLHHTEDTLVLIHKWHNSYRDLMSLSSLRVMLNTLTMEHLKAKYHLMEATYLILQFSDCETDVMVECTCVIASNLFNEFFTDDYKLQDGAQLTLQRILDSFNLSLQKLQFNQIPKEHLYQHISEGLFIHFFSMSPYSKEDIECFMNLANKEVTWKNCLQEIPAENATDSCSCVNVSKLKFTLDKILSKDEKDSNDKDVAKPLKFYKSKFRMYIGETILDQCTEAIPAQVIPSEYVPVYLTQAQASKNPLMQQRLTHLYFYTVLERLQSCQYNPSQLVTLIDITDKKLFETDSNAEKLLLHIERQALIEVLLEAIVNNFHMDSNEIHLKYLLKMSEVINSLVKDTSHYNTLLMHLMKRWHGPRGVLNLLSEENKRWWEHFNCFRYIKEELKTFVSTSHLFPFVLGSRTAFPMITSLHKEICSQLLSIADNPSPRKETKFKRLINKDKSDERISNIRMMIWLCVYHEFYCKEKQDSKLITLFRDVKDSLKLSDELLLVLECFLDPTKMIKEEEVPDPLDPDEEVFEYIGGQIREKKPPSDAEKIDLIWNFFNPENKDPLDTDLRHALANMIAVVFALPNHSNHIWYHMFCPGELEDSHMTGFMKPDKVKKGGLMYDCGCEIDTDGQFGREEYKQHSSSRALSLHSWYLMLWTNFGAFCVGLLTQPNVKTQLKGQILSDWKSIRFYCMAQLNTVWLHMGGKNFLCDHEERSFFIMRSMHTLIELSLVNKLPFSQGKFDDIESLNAYEKAWHECIYKPSKADLQIKLGKHSSESVWALAALKYYRMLDQQYPHKITEADYMKALVAARENRVNDSYVFALYHFTIRYKRMQLGGVLLPDLVEFYQWIHTHLSHLVTFDRAQKITIGQVISLSAKRYSHAVCTHLTQLLGKLIEKYNAYLQIHGGTIGEASCDRTAKPTDAHYIDKDTPLINLVSHDNEDIFKYDWLYIVMMDIIGNHNHFLNSVFENATKHPDCQYKKYLPDNPSELHPVEITDHRCITPFTELKEGEQQFLKLINSCFLHNDAQSTAVFDLNHLEQDVVAYYIAGKPLIKETTSIRIIFRFRDSPEVTLENNPGCVIDISSVAQELPIEFKDSLQQETRKLLGLHFHNATYQVLTDIVNGLRLTLGHTIKDVIQQENSKWESTLNVSLADHLKEFYEEENVFHKIGIQCLSDTQLAVLGKIQMKRLFRSMELFLEWLQGGLYDFSSLPFSIFKHLENEDMETLMNIPDKYPSTEMEQLFKEVDEFEKTLSHVEQNLTIETDHGKSIIEYLVDFGFCDLEKEMFATYVPKTILVCHYTHSRMALRKLKMKVKELANLQTQVSSTAVERWTEIIEDLWNKLPHIRDKELYNNEQLKSECMNQQFGEAEESESDNETWVNTFTSNEEKSEKGKISQNQAIQIEENPEVKKAVLLGLPSDKAMNMSHKELCNWLREKKIAGKYLHLFEEDETIDGEELSIYTEKELEQMGISESRIRIKILLQFRRI